MQKITITRIEKPFMSSYSLGGELDVSELLDKKQITITATHETKTRVYTSLQIGMYRVGVNWEIEGYKTDSKQARNFFDYELVTANYFKKCKAQGSEQYERYIKDIVLQFLTRAGVELDEVEILLDDRIEW